MRLLLLLMSNVCMSQPGDGNTHCGMPSLSFFPTVTLLIGYSSAQNLFSEVAGKEMNQNVFASFLLFSDLF